MMSYLAKIAHRLFHYYSTSCLHGDHEYCQNEMGVIGKKAPGQCKFCGALCKCRCHRNSNKKMVKN